MKKLLLLVITMCSLTSFAQNEYKKVPKGFCKVDHTCRLSYKYDSFDDYISYYIGFYETNISKKQVLSYDLTKYVKDDVNVYYWTLFGNKTGCRTDKSYVHIKFKDGEDLKIFTPYNNIDCGISALTLNITDYIEALSTKEISQIRIHIEYDDDYEVSDKGQEKFFNNLKCIQEANYVPEK